MATKQTALRTAKQAKRRNSSKERIKKANAVQAATKVKLKNEEQQRSMIREIATKGPVEAARKIYRKGKGKTNIQKLTNKIVMENINFAIVATIKQHAGVEVFTRLAAEKKFVIQPVEQQLIDLLDEQVVRMCENINVISEFVEANKTPEDYMEIFVDYTQLVAQLTEETFPAVTDMLAAKGDLLDEYANEHIGERKLFDYMEQIHSERMPGIIEKYATRIGSVELNTEPLHAYTPDNQQPSDPLIDDDVAEAELVIEPNLEKDVETINQ